MKLYNYQVPTSWLGKKLKQKKKPVGGPGPGRAEVLIYLDGQVSYSRHFLFLRFCDQFFYNSTCEYSLIFLRWMNKVKG